jgi:hypothetical protein
LALGLILVKSQFSVCITFDVDVMVILHHYGLHEMIYAYIIAIFSMNRWFVPGLPGGGEKSGGRGLRAAGGHFPGRWKKRRWKFPSPLYDL